MASFRLATALFVCVVMLMYHASATDFDDCEICVSVVRAYSPRRVCASRRSKFSVLDRKEANCKKVKNFFRDNYMEFLDVVNTNGVKAVWGVFRERLDANFDNRKYPVTEELCNYVANALPIWDGACMKADNMVRCLQMEKRLRHSTVAANSIANAKANQDSEYDTCNNRAVKGVAKLSRKYLCKKKIEKSPFTLGNKPQDFYPDHARNLRRSVLTRRLNPMEAFKRLLESTTKSADVIHSSLELQQQQIGGMYGTLQEITEDLKQTEVHLDQAGKRSTLPEDVMKDGRIEVLSGTSLSMVKMTNVVRIYFVEKMSQLYQRSNRCFQEGMLGVETGAKVIKMVTEAYQKGANKLKFTVKEGIQDPALVENMQPGIDTVGNRVSTLLEQVQLFKASEAEVPDVLNQMGFKIEQEMDRLCMGYLWPKLHSMFGKTPKVESVSPDLPDDFDAERYFKTEFDVVRKKFADELNHIIEGITEEVESREHAKKKWGGLRNTDDGPKLAARLEKLIEDMFAEARKVQAVEDVYHKSKNSCIFAQAALRELPNLKPPGCEHTGDDLTIEAYAKRFLCQIIDSLVSLAGSTARGESLTCSAVYFCEEAAATLSRFLHNSAASLEHLSNGLKHERFVNNRVRWLGSDFPSVVKKEVLDRDPDEPTGDPARKIMKNIQRHLAEPIQKEMKVQLFATRELFTRSMMDHATRALENVRRTVTAKMGEFLEAIGAIVRRQVGHLNSVIRSAVHEAIQLDLALNGFLGSESAQAARRRTFTQEAALGVEGSEDTDGVTSVAVDLPSETSLASEYLPNLKGHGQKRASNDPLWAHGTPLPSASDEISDELPNSSDENDNEGSPMSDESDDEERVTNGARKRRAGGDQPALAWVNEW